MAAWAPCNRATDTKLNRDVDIKVRRKPSRGRRAQAED
jgi:hypothetical protein